MPERGERLGVPCGDASHQVNVGVANVQARFSSHDKIRTPRFDR